MQKLLVDNKNDRVKFSHDHLRRTKLFGPQLYLLAKNDFVWTAPTETLSTTLIQD